MSMMYNIPVLMLWLEREARQFARLKRSRTCADRWKGLNVTVSSARSTLGTGKQRKNIGGL
jgi:hypothetical protein